MLHHRARTLHAAPVAETGPILYWMDRDMRLHDNWAYEFSKKLADQEQVPLIVVYNLDTDFLGGGYRQLCFKIQGLHELQELSRQMGISFVVVQTTSERSGLEPLIERYRPRAIVTDFGVLRAQRAWRADLIKHLQIPLIEVDAHNVVPAWIASQKCEIGARTLRPKIHRLLWEYLVPFPDLRAPQIPFWEVLPSLDLSAVLASSTDREPAISSEFSGGYSLAKKALWVFLEERLGHYDTDRNDACQTGQSDLSPYLHYGMIAPARVALEAMKFPASPDREAFLEELIVRRELAENWCLYRPDHYDALSSAPRWAQQSLDRHRNDPREYLYTREQLENGATHDPLWNAAQKELLQRGKMHGYLRMYWCKKILEWTPDPETAIAYAIFLNDRYQLDGRDPNGYTGILWSIAGVHDRPWFDREVYGVVRYMARSGCQKKFDTEAYIARWNR